MRRGPRKSKHHKKNLITLKEKKPEFQIVMLIFVIQFQVFESPKLELRLKRFVGKHFFH